MDLGDISAADFEERQEHFKKQVSNENSSLETQAWAFDYGRDMATAEMLNEIHVMLRELLKRSNP